MAATIDRPAARHIHNHLTWCRVAGLATRTRIDRAKLLRRLDRDLPHGLLHACEDELLDWLARHGRTNQTIRTYANHIRGFYRWGVAAHQLTIDPSTRLPRPRVPARAPRPAPEDLLARILVEALPRYQLWALLACYAGLRCAEVAGLQRRDCTPTEIYVRGKGGRERVVPMHPRVWIAVRDLPDGQIAGIPPAVADRAAYVSRMFRTHVHNRFGARLGLHALRHWYATAALRGCGNLRTVQELLGHASPETTAVYTKNVSAERVAAVATLPDLSMEGTR